MIPEKKDLEDLYETLSLNDIAKYYSVTKTSVGRWFNKYNIPRIAPGYTKDCLDRYNKDFSNDMKCFLVGSLLGDGHISTNKRDGKISLSKMGKTARFEVRHSIKQFDYVKWKKEILDEYVGDINFGVVKIKNKVHKTCGFKSYSHPEFLYFRDLFYIENVKCIDYAIKDYLTPFSMAIWLMDDGTLKKSANRIIMCTDCFSLKDHNILKSIIYDRFGVISKISKIKNGYNLYFNTKESKYISEIVRPYVIDSMRYKLVT